MANEVTLTFSGESKDLDRTLAGVSGGLSKMDHDLDDSTEKTKKFGKGIDGMADAAGNSESKLMGVNDLVGGFADVAGIALPPQFQMVMGFADMAGGMEKLIPTMSKMKDVQKVLNATMKANPILTVIGLLTLLVGGFIVAYKKSETFRKIVNGSLAAVKKVATGLGDAFEAAWHKIRDVFQFIADRADWLLYASPLGLLIKALDKLGAVGKLKGLVGKLPGFANGGRPNGPSIVGERGPELFIPDGSSGRIVPMNQLSQGGGGQGVTISWERSSDPIFEAIKKQVRIRGGVDRAFA